MKSKVLSVILIFSLALNLAVIGTFIFRKIDPPEGPGALPPFDLQGLPFYDTTPMDREQRQEMRQLMRDFKQQNRENRFSIFELEDELLHTLRQADYDSTRVDSLIEKISQLRMLQSKQAIKHFRKFNKFLTPEQQVHFHQMIMERPGRFGMRNHEWREFRGRRNDMHRNFYPDSTDIDR